MSAISTSPHLTELSNHVDARVRGHRQWCMYTSVCVCISLRVSAYGCHTSAARRLLIVKRKEEKEGREETEELPCSPEESSASSVCRNPQTCHDARTTLASILRMILRTLRSVG